MDDEPAGDPGPTEAPQRTEAPHPTETPERTEAPERTAPPPPRVQRTRTSSLLVATTLGLILLIFMLVFVLQNQTDVALQFLWLDFTLPAGVMTLLAAAGGGLIVGGLALGRVLQLRLAARRRG